MSRPDVKAEPGMKTRGIASGRRRGRAPAASSSARRPRGASCWSSGSSCSTSHAYLRPPAGRDSGDRRSGRRGERPPGGPWTLSGTIRTSGAFRLWVSLRGAGPWRARAWSDLETPILLAVGGPSMRMSRLGLIGLAMMAILAWVLVARADLDAVAQAMGAAKVDSLQITGGGFMYTLGQAYQPGKAWPKLNLSRFTRSDDYAGAAHAFDYYVSRAEPQGGGAVPPDGRSPAHRRREWRSGLERRVPGGQRGPGGAGPLPARSLDQPARHREGRHGRQGADDRLHVRDRAGRPVSARGRPSAPATWSRRSSRGSTTPCWVTWPSSRCTATTRTTAASSSRVA